MNQLDEIRKAIESLKEVTDSLSKMLEVKETVKPKAEVKFETLRKLLSEKSSKGHRADVVNLIHKYGGQRLSDIKPEDYEKLYEDAKELADE